MRRVQVRLRDAHAAHLARRAAARGISVGDAILEAVEEQLAADEKQRRIKVALAALEKQPFRFGLTDLAENHDEYIGQALDEEVERWRRG